MCNNYDENRHVCETNDIDHRYALLFFELEMFHVCKTIYNTNWNTIQTVIYIFFLVPNIYLRVWTLVFQ